MSPLPRLPLTTTAVLVGALCGSFSQPALSRGLTQDLPARAIYACLTRGVRHEARDHLFPAQTVNSPLCINTWYCPSHILKTVSSHENRLWTGKNYSQQNSACMALAWNVLKFCPGECLVTYSCWDHRLLLATDSSVPALHGWCSPQRSVLERTRPAVLQWPV